MEQTPSLRQPGNFLLFSKMILDKDDLYRVRAQISATLYRVDSPYPFIQFTVSNGRESVAFHLPERIRLEYNIAFIGSVTEHSSTRLLGLSIRCIQLKTDNWMSTR